MPQERQDNLRDYIEVNVRIEKFWFRFPNGRIDTEVTFHPEEKGVAIVKASVYRDAADPVPAATGHAYEKEGSSFINKTSYIENCETSAVGRALAILGFEIKKSVASKEEVANAKLQQEQQTNGSRSQQINRSADQVIEPIPTQTRPEPAEDQQTGSGSSRPANTFPTEAQMKMIHAKLANSGYVKTDGEIIRQVIANIIGYEIKTLTDIRRGDITKVAEFLTTHRKENTQ